MTIRILLLLTLYFLLHSVQSFACTIFQTTDATENVLIGRNFDWDKTGGNIWFIPATKEANGIVLFEQDGQDQPYEGVNTYGLFVGIAAVPDTETPLSPFKPMRKSREMVRVILEQASNTEEAIQLFNDYTVLFGKFLGYPQVHYLLADSEGNSAIVDYIDNGIKVTKSNGLGQILTNHYPSNPDLGAITETSIQRYQIVKDGMANGTTSVEDAQVLLKEAAQKSTIWSNVYDINNQRIYVTYGDSKPVVVDLKTELYGGKHGYALEDLQDRTAIIVDEKSFPVTVRPQFGYGVLEGKSIAHYGVRLLLPASEVRKFGVEINRFDDGDNQQFTTAGLVLEQRLFGWFNMSIGTIGYFDYGKDSENTVGLTTNLGWEPDYHTPVYPFITYRFDLIFSDHTDQIHSISAGFAMDF